MHRDHAVAVAVLQSLAVCFGELDGRRAGRRNAGKLMDVVRHIIDTITQVNTVDKHVQRHLANVPLFEVI